jgi:hypothetical protein
MYAVFVRRLLLEMQTEFNSGNLKGRDHLDDLRVGRRMKLGM